MFYHGKGYMALNEVGSSW